MNYFFYILFFIFLFSKVYVNDIKWWNKAVFYEIFVRSFYDSNNDGIGDLNGLISKLDYLNDGNPRTDNDLGINAIWLMPIFESPSYHGYDIIDYYSIDQEYGNMKDFENLIAEAHKRGIKIILDLVINHTSTLNDWFILSSKKDPEYDEFYIWTNKIPRGEWGKPWGGGNPSDVWKYNPVRKEYYYAVFSPGMPDLNFKNNKVKEKIKEIAKFWLDKGVDGFRLDAARYIIEDGPGIGQLDTEDNIKWWTEFSSYIKSINSNAVLVGEVWAGNHIVQRYYNNGNGLDLCFDFDFADKAILTGSYGNFENIINNFSSKKNNNVSLSFFAPFLSNHDQIRAMNVILRNFLKAKILATILLTVPGTPFIYYGEEIGMIQEQGYRDEFKRAPMNWDNTPNAGFTKSEYLWAKPYWNNDPHNVEFQQKDPDSLLNLYKKLIRLRLENNELLLGNIEFVKLTNNKKTIVYKREFDNNSVFIVINGSLNTNYITLDFLNKGNYKDLINNKDLEINNKDILLKPFEFLVIKEIK